MPAINIGDVQLVVQTVQQTQPSLKIMDDSGDIYYVNMTEGACPQTLKIKSGDKVYTAGARTLYHQVSTTDSCDSVSLQPGCYFVEILGGNGGSGGNQPTNNGTGATPQTFSFSIDTTTTVYVFRGGDGQNGGVNSASNGLTSGGGGGASGAPSFFQIGSDYIISQGGTGGIGGMAKKSDGSNQNCGAGGGGGITGATSGLGSVGSDAWDASGFVCGAGGGGSLGGTGGAASSGFLYNGSAGTDATDSAAGNGGNCSVGGLLGSSSATGGTGGANVAYTCGSQTFYSYGGGGGGAVSMGGLFGTGGKVNGGTGGSGTTGGSNTSYVKIYRLG